MNIKIVYDNQAVPGFRSGWGFSALVDGTTLFDVGERVEPLRENLAAFGVDPKGITRVVLSHEHWDHVGGIGILAEMHTPTVYLPAAFTERFKRKITTLQPAARVVEVEGLTPLGDGLFATPPLEGKRWELSLAARGPDGRVVLVVGCSHPGLDRILAEARAIGPVAAVLGGFHGFRNLDALTGLAWIGPTHCTRRKKDILKRFPDTAHPVAAGMDFELPPPAFKAAQGSRE